MKGFKLPLKLLNNNYETAIKILRKFQLHSVCEKDSENLIFPIIRYKIWIFNYNYYENTYFFQFRLLKTPGRCNYASD